MSSQAPRGRQSTGSGRSGGGRALMLFGVLLALLSGVLVIYIVSQATSSAGAKVELVVAKATIPSGTTLTPNNIGTYFGEVPYPANIVPAGAYVYAGQDALQSHLNQTVVLVEIVPGDVLLTQDPRIGPPGTNPGSLVSKNAAAITGKNAGNILYPFNYSYPSSATSSFVNAGDYVDILALECNAPFATSSGQCRDQTTLQGIQVYATYSSTVVLILTPLQAKELAILAQSGTITLALRADNNTANNDNTVAVTPSYVASQFHY